MGSKAISATRPGQGLQLRDAIAALAAQLRTRPADQQFGYVLIDCPPSLNILTLNAMAAANAVLVPVQCEFFALEGISQLKETIDQIRATINPSLEIQGVVLTMHDARTSLSREVAEEVRAFFGPKVYESVIPRNTRVAEAPSHGKPILLYDYDCAGSQAYIRLATEIIERERQNKAAVRGSKHKLLRGQFGDEFSAAEEPLGPGIGLLIGEVPQSQPRASQDGEQRSCPIELLRGGKFNPRKDFAEAELTELADSIRPKGLIQPIVVRPHPEDAQSFEIVAGERRWRAAQRAGIHSVPIIVRELTDKEVLELAIIENVQRADLNAIEEANGYRELIERFQL